MEWDVDPPSGTDTYVYSPSWHSKSPWMATSLNLIVDAGDTYTSFEWGIQITPDDDDVTDADADWYTLVRPGSLHGSGESDPQFSNAGPVSLFADAAFTKAASSQDDICPLDGNPSVDQFVPVVGRRMRIACEIVGAVAGGTATEWTIKVMEGTPA